MSYVCISCGAEAGYDHLVKHKLKCTKCREKRSNIWVKKRPPVSKTVIAR